MANDFQPPVGGDLSAAIAAAKAVEAEARAAELSLKRAEKAGDRLDEKEVKREAARKRVRDRPYSKGGSDQLNLDLDEELQVRKTKNAEILAEEQRALQAQQRINNARRAEEAREARRKPYRLAEVGPTGKVKKVLSYYDDLDTAQRRAQGATYGGKRVIAQENPNFSQRLADAERRAAEAEARAAAPRPAAVVAPKPDVGLRARTVATPESQVALARRDLAVQQALTAELETQLASRRENGQAVKDAERKFGVEKRREARMAAALANLESEQLAAAAQAYAAQEQVTAARLAQARDARALPAGRAPLQLPAAGQTGAGLQTRGGVERGPTAGRVFYGSPSSAPDERQYVPAGGAPPPPPPPKPPVKQPAPGGDPDGAKAMAANHEKLAAEVRRSNAAIQSGTAVINASQNAYRQHGALTTEFINAAAKGQTSYREWGYQIGATAAKFAGWTLVSVPVFAAIDGIRKIGAGAIDASTGVNQLQRVINNVDSSKAQGAFRDLSSQFNVPIAEASQAVYLMGQRFHDLPSAVNAAKAVLYSFKTGDVPIEQSARNLTSVINGFGLSADALLPIFDKINNAQNQFGVSIDDTEQGLAKAAGGYKNAGGSVEYLLSLIASAKLATGRTGQNIGTALQRSVGFIQRPSNQAALQQYGIDTGQGIDQIYQQAFEKAKGLQGEQLQELATALSSPQYASYFVPLLQNYSNATSGFKKVLDSTLNDSDNSGAKELERVLGSVRERISEIGNELQRLGSELVQSGAAVPFGATLTAIDKTLTLANSLLEVFNKLPNGVKSAAVSAAELYGLLRLVRRVGVGENLPGAAGRFLSQTPAQRARIAGRQTLQENREFLQTRVGTYATRARETALSHVVALQSEQAAHRENVAAIQSGDPERIEKAQANLVKAEERRVALAEKLNQQEVERIEVSRLLKLQAEEELALARSRTPLKFLEERGTVIPGEMGRATDNVGVIESGAYRSYPTRAFPVRDPLPAGVAGPATLNVAQDEAIKAETALASASVIQNNEVRTRAARQTASIRNLRTSIAGTGASFAALRQQTSTLGATMLTAGGVASNTADSLKRGTAAGTARLSSALTSLRTGIAGMFGPLDLIFIGVTAAVEIGRHQLEERAKQAREADSLATAKITAASAPALRERYQKDLNKAAHPGLLGSFQPGLQGRKEQDLQSIAAIDAAERANAAALEKGQARPFVGSSSVLQRLKETQGEFRRGALTVAQYRKALDVIEEEARGIGDSGKSNVTGKISQARLAAAPQKSQIAQLFGGPLGFNAISGDQLKKDVDAYTQIVSGVHATSKQIQTLTAEVLAKLAQLSGSTSPEYQAQITPLIQSTAQGIAAGAQAELDQALLFARSRDARQKAYADYARRLNSGNGAFGQARNQLVQRRTKVEDNLQTAQNTPDADNQGVLGFIQNQLADAKRDSRIKALRQGKKAIDAQIKTLGKANKALREELRVVAREQQRAQYQNQEAINDAQTQVTAANTNAGAPRARFLLQAIGQKVQRAIREFGRDSAEALTLIAQQQEAANAVVEEQLGVLQARGGLAASRAGDNQTAAAGAQISSLRQQLALMRAHPHQYGEKEIDGVLQQIQDAQNQQAAAAKQAAEDRRQKAEEARQKAEDLLAARNEFLQSMTDDPVELARLQYQASQETVQKGNFKSKADRYRALAERNKNRRAYNQAKGQSAYDDIEFYASIGKYTTDQEVTALKNLEKTLKNNKTLKREIQQRIYSLTHQDQNDGELDLNLNNIRLPTLYEIRRATQTQHGGTQITNRNTATVIVNNPTDVPAVARALEDHNSGLGKAMARAGGYR